jgi:hypothetical protein
LNILRSVLSKKILVGLLCWVVLIGLNGLVFASSSIRGEMAICKIKINKKQFIRSLNQNNAFERVYRLQPAAIAFIEVNFPQASTGDTVVAEVHDGGVLNDSSTVLAMEMSNDKKINFKFTAGSNPGVYSISLKKGNDIKTIELWVGEEIKPSAD